MASEYGRYESTAKKEYGDGYIKPQETGRHYCSSEVALENGVSVFAEKPFSFSVLPYSTKQLKSAAHDFELPVSDGVYVNLDLAMSGIGTASCGPELRQEYRAAKEGAITFRLQLDGNGKES